ncbi:hypothetical protein C0Q70_12183 [Pomacea canaliculata]|uniref:Ig-like domain-containing protein n=1 Tax=Pomacea canaliculata TaxID=400727 RepID=A0A2T7P0U9_POMCA|nr:hypothetical protein C0Q70_12183 [Pomacea canaliculata]
MEWRLYTKDTSNLIAKLINSQIVENSFYYAFVASISDEGILLTINTRNIKDIYLLSGAVVCSDLTESTLTYAGCQLNYVYKPKASDVSCTATDDPSGVNLSCTINNTYSSRGIYTCQALRQKDEEHSIVEELNIVDMAGLHYGRGIKFSEIKPREKLSLTCTSDTGYVEWTLVAGKGGAQQHLATRCLFAERPAPPNGSCHPGGHVLENTDVSCVCRTTSLGQPQGSLRWVVGYGTNTVKPTTTSWSNENSPELRYSRTLTMSDHGRTWLRCQLVWGAEELGGDTYMASVAQRPSQPKIACYPSPYVLENTNISCTCNTTSLGLPAGYLTWVTGNYSHKGVESINRGKGWNDKPTTLYYSKTLTLADHGTTWFRCDITWKGQKVLGEIYTANVGSLPRLPKMVCHPAPYVLENTNISCTCSTTSLGKPAGYLTWVTGKYTHGNFNNPLRGDRSDDKRTELHYSQTLTLADHSNTWFRCDVTWGGQKHRGENYTANTRHPQLSLNKLSKNVTVTESDSVDVNCSADGRPEPTVILFNAVNNTKMATGSSVILTNFSARCQDGGEYTCSAENYFSSQSPLKTSLTLQN